jgi:hypothetical protein
MRPRQVNAERKERKRSGEPVAARPNTDNKGEIAGCKDAHSQYYAAGDGAHDGATTQGDEEYASVMNGKANTR